MRRKRTAEGVTGSSLQFYLLGTPRDLAVRESAPGGPARRAAHQYLVFPTSGNWGERSPSAHSEELIHVHPMRTALGDPLNQEDRWRVSVSQETSDSQSGKNCKTFQLHPFPYPPSLPGTLEHHSKHLPHPQSKSSES